MSFAINDVKVSDGGANLFPLSIPFNFDPSLLYEGPSFLPVAP